MSESTEFGPYVPVRVLATGAHSQVWLANGPAGEVALKVARTQAARSVLLHEADILERCRHPNIVRLVDRAPDGRWIATERAKGMLVEQFGQVRPIGEMVAVATALVDALEALHAQGIVHGDVKPGNVLVDLQGRPVLVDLGISVLPGDERRGFRGTLGYLAPEVLRGDTPTPRSDLYGLGATLYAALTERAPFVAPDPAALTYLPLVSLPPPPNAFRPDLPAPFVRLVLSLLARDPKRRPDGKEIREMLGQVAGARPPAPVLGMHAEREELRKAVVGAADGEPRVVVLYGPAGSGRRTLITEAVEYARREGLPYVKASDPKQALAQLRAEKGSSVLVLRSMNSSRRLAQLVLDEGLPSLVLLYADRPVPTLPARGVVQLTPSPLDVREVAQLARVWGADPENAEAWWRESLGLPIGVVGRIRRWRREQGGGAFDPAVLPAESRRVLEVIREKGEVAVPALAEALSLGEHQLLDQCEVLFAEGVVSATDDGSALRAVQGGA